VGEAAVLTLDDPRWSVFVEQQPDATAFHRPGWARALAASYGFEPFVVAVLEQDRVEAGAPFVAVAGRRSRRWVSLPFTDQCAPLGQPSAARALVGELERIRLANAVTAVELRGALDAAVGMPFVAGVTHVLELDGDIEQVRRRLHPSLARRNVDRARREGVHVTMDSTRDSLVETFYRLHLGTRRRQGVPVQPRRFFSHLWEQVVAPGGGFVVVAYVRGRAAASALFLDGIGTLTYKFGASDPTLLYARPNHAVFWAAIEWAHEAGRARLDFGRTDAENAGLRAFKSSWGAEEHPLVYTMLGRMPRDARDRARLLRPLIKRSPPVVCRLLGEALYRRAA
jgi:CelD/BcsL family acetyltransferase involved in cellulose biosynthesis